MAAVGPFQLNSSILILTYQMVVVPFHWYFFSIVEKPHDIGQVSQFLLKAVMPSLVFHIWFAACLLSFPLSTVFSLMLFGEKVFLPGGGNREGVCVL